MTTEEILRAKYDNAILLNVDQLAEILHRSSAALRISLNEGGELASKINPCKVKIGRRLYFRLLDIARVIDEGSVN